MKDVEELKSLIGNYFDLGVAEGVEGRNYDTKDHAASRKLEQINSILDGKALVPVEITTEILVAMGYVLNRTTYEQIHKAYKAMIEEAAADKKFDRDAKQINDLVTLLFDAWKKSEPTHPITKNPVSYMATFTDMARAVLANQNRKPDEP